MFWLIACFITICILIIAYGWIHLYFDKNKEECKEPVILKKKIEKKLKEEDEKLFKDLIESQNLNIINAIMNNRNECFYGFYEHYRRLYPDKYRDWFTERAKEYYKKYKIDGDKISWD